MSHSPHQSQPGYHPGQILVDGCEECLHRSARSDHGLDNLDPQAFERAWYRAIRWQRDGGLDISSAEIALLRVLWSVQVQLERRGVPIGHIPDGTLIVTDLASCGHQRNEDGECNCSIWPERAADQTASHEV